MSSTTNSYSVVRALLNQQCTSLPSPQLSPTIDTKPPSQCSANSCTAELYKNDHSPYEQTEMECSAEPCSGNTVYSIRSFKPVPGSSNCNESSPHVTDTGGTVSSSKVAKRKRLDSVVNNLLSKKCLVDNTASSSLSEAASSLNNGTSAIMQMLQNPLSLSTTHVHCRSSTSEVFNEPDSTTNPVNDLSPQISQASSKFGRDLTTPKLSRHNDAAYYPNIQCILCSEWVCSRNRYMHIESHLQYRPYKCSVCGYDNRKEIFINLHIKRTHRGAGQVVYEPNQELEHKAWRLAEQCLQHTRQVLLQRGKDVTSLQTSRSAPKLSNLATSKGNAACNADLYNSVLQPFRDVYRPRIYNTQRAEKSQLIEESCQLGLVPDFTEVANREEACGICGSHVLRHQSVLEEHVRVHLSKASYRCNIDGCMVEHESKNFISRHMKEVHKYRRQPMDIMDHDKGLTNEFLVTCAKSFNSYFDAETVIKLQHRYYNKGLNCQSHPALVNRYSESSATKDANYVQDRDCHESTEEQATLPCRLCGVFVEADKLPLLRHAQCHFGKGPVPSLDGLTKFMNEADIYAQYLSGQADLKQILLNTCFGGSKILEESSSQKSVKQQSTISCSLCHIEIPSHLKNEHAKLHALKPLLNCNFCDFQHIDEQEMMEHTQSKHQSYLYSKKPVQNIQPVDVENNQALNVCFSEVGV